MGPNAEHALVAQVMGLASMDLVEMALATVMKDGTEMTIARVTPLLLHKHLERAQVMMATQIGSLSP